MGVRVNKRIKIFPGVYLNITKSGPSISIGPQGAKINIGPNGAKVNAGIPGTGVSYNKKIGGSSNTKKGKNNKSNSTTNLLLMIVGVGCIMLGNQYKDQCPMASYLIYAGIGILIVWLLVVLFFKKKKEEDSSDEIPSLGGTKKGGKTQKKGKITDDDDIPELSYANQSSITDIMKEQLRDKVKNAPELQQLDPRLADSAKMVVHYQDADAILLQSKLKLDEERTKVILRQLELLSIVGMEQADGSRSVLIKNENDLAEIMDVVFE